MDYNRFLAFNVFGGMGWVFGLTSLGYLLGNVPLVKNNFEKVILLIIFVSFLPAVIEVVRHRLAARRVEAEEAPVAVIDSE